MFFLSANSRIQIANNRLGRKGVCFSLCELESASIEQSEGPADSPAVEIRYTQRN